MRKPLRTRLFMALLCGVGSVGAAVWLAHALFMGFCENGCPEDLTPFYVASWFGLSEAAVGAAVAAAAAITVKRRWIRAAIVLVAAGCVAFILWLSAWQIAIPENGW